MNFGDAIIHDEELADVSGSGPLENGASKENSDESPLDIARLDGSDHIAKNSDTHKSSSRKKLSHEDFPIPGEFEYRLFSAEERHFFGDLVPYTLDHLSLRSFNP